MSSEFTGRVALVTGGSRGIGRATALRLAEEGAGVLMPATVANLRRLWNRQAQKGAEPMAEFQQTRALRLPGAESGGWGRRRHGERAAVRHGGGTGLWSRAYLLRGWFTFLRGAF